MTAQRLKITPGEWRVELDETYNVRASHGGVLCQIHWLNGRHGLNGRIDGEEGEANARFIAEAGSVCNRLQLTPLQMEQRMKEAEDCLTRAGYNPSADGKTWVPPVNRDAFAPKFFAAEQRIQKFYEALEEINQHLRDVVETSANGDVNNWNGYYLPLFKQLSEKYTAALQEGGR